MILLIFMSVSEEGVRYGYDMNDTENDIGIIYYINCYDIGRNNKFINRYIFGSSSWVKYVSFELFIAQEYQSNYLYISL